VWDALAGDYPCDDGWVRLHTNYPHHRDACLRALDAPPDRAALAAIVQARSGDDVETAVVDAGGCAARLRPADAWAVHAQGSAVAREPLLHVERSEVSASPHRHVIRVVDLTRVIAGPLAGKVLAAHGCEVTRVDPPGFVEVPTVEVDTSAGKQRRRIDLRDGEGRAALLEMIAASDVVLHGYRPGALDALGLGEDVWRAANPALVIGRLDAYGYSGPWASRRGFDSLVQMSSGIAWPGDVASRPTPLPCQALDHATGWMLAAAVLRGLTDLRRDGAATTWRTSLARTAALLTGSGETGDPSAPPLDFAPYMERANTPWGPVERVRIPGVPAPGN